MVLRGFELRFCACMLAGGVSGAPPYGCGARRWRRGARGTLAACRAGSRGMAWGGGELRPAGVRGGAPGHRCTGQDGASSYW